MQAEQQAAFAINALVRGSPLCITTSNLQIQLCLHKLAALYRTGGRLYRTFVRFSQLFSRWTSYKKEHCGWKKGSGGDRRFYEGRVAVRGVLEEAVGEEERAVTVARSPVKLLISVFSYSVLRLRSQPTRPAPILLKTIAPGAGITGTSLMPMRTR